MGHVMHSKYDLPSLPLGSDEGLVALFHDILPPLMIRVDSMHPGISSSAFDILEEDGIYAIFKNCCELLGYEIRHDHSSDMSFLTKMPEAVFVANRIDMAAHGYAEKNNIDELDMYKVAGSGKTPFSVVADRMLCRYGGFMESNDGSVATWKFLDGSVLKITGKNGVSPDLSGFVGVVGGTDSFDRHFLNNLRSAISTETSLESSVS